MRGKMPGSEKVVTRNQKMVEEKQASTKARSGSEASYSVVAHVQRKRLIGTMIVTHAHKFGSRSSGGPVIRCPQQQKVLRAGQTM